MRTFCKNSPKKILGLGLHNYKPVDVALMDRERHIYSVLMRCTQCKGETIRSGYDLTDLLNLGYTSQQILYFNARYGRKRLPGQRERPENSPPE